MSEEAVLETFALCTKVEGNTLYCCIKPPARLAATCPPELREMKIGSISVAACDSDREIFRRWMLLMRDVAVIAFREGAGVTPGPIDVEGALKALEH